MRWIIAIVTAAWIIGIGPAYWLLIDEEDAPALPTWLSAVLAVFWPVVFYFGMLSTVLSDLRKRFRR